VGREADTAGGGHGGRRTALGPKAAARPEHGRGAKGGRLGPEAVGNPVQGAPLYRETCMPSNHHKETIHAIQ